MAHTVPISIIIPTYQREQVLVDTLSYLLELPTTAQEIVVVDQTPHHQPEVVQQLQQWHDHGQINWLRFSPPSIPNAMNQGLLAATCPWVLFLDDDILPGPELVAAHWQAHQIHDQILVAGRVVQPWEEGKVMTQTIPSSQTFATESQAWITLFMGGNFSMSREQLLDLGGFDQNFVGAAYQFEAECAHRLISRGGKILFEPAATIHHLKVTNGGVRSYGHHLTTWQPHHAVGYYYHLFRTAGPFDSLQKTLHRLLRSIITRHHLRRPWWIPATLTSELWGLLWALKLSLRGPRYIKAAV